MGEKLNAAIAGLMIATGCVSGAEGEVEQPLSVSEQMPVVGKKGCSFNRPHKEMCDGLTDEERTKSRKIVETTKQNLLEGLGGVQEGLHSGRFVDSDIFTSATLVSLPDEKSPFAVSCDSESLDHTFNELVQKVVKNTRAMIAPGLENIDENFTNEVVNLDMAGENIVVCARTELERTN